jgi:acetyl-CoA/propionyl-CoA carboxylase biotin carboxyl carrier protein
MNGNLVKWVLEDGAAVAEGDTIAVLEAMKMESNIAAHRAGTFTRGAQAPGVAIARGDVLGSIA